MSAKLKWTIVAGGLLTMIMFLLVAGCQKNPEEKGIAQLQGTWVAILGGQETYITFSGYNFEIKNDITDLASGTVKINIDPDPKEIDLTSIKHADEEYIGETQLGIYNIQGNKLFLAAGKLGVERPRKFKDNKDVSFAVFIRQ